MKIGILGSGTWAMGIASVLLENNHEIILWARDEKQIISLQKTGKNYKYALPCTLEGNISFTNNISDIEKVDFLINAIPTQKIRSVFEKIKNLDTNTIIVNASKGIEVDSLKLVSEIIKDFYPDNTYVLISGPSHAEEIAKKLPTTLVASSDNKEKSKEVRDLFFNEYCRVYTNDDLKGSELAGALKNIIALAAGISDGLGYGHNTKAALMTRGITEIKRLGNCMGASPETFDGLTGIGDLIVTCTSILSRNMRCGKLIGEGLSLEEASKRIGMVVEGASTVKAAYKLAVDNNCEMPITESLYNVLYNNYDPKKAVSSLMIRKLKDEKEDKLR